MVRQRTHSSKGSNTRRAQTEQSLLEGNPGSNNVQRLPKTSTEWTCHIEWFNAKGRSLCYGPMNVSLFRPPTRSPKGGNQPSESSMGHGGSSGRTSSPNFVSEESEHG
jgi:hypothetical protein